MATTAQVTALGMSPFEQIQHVGSAFSTALSALFESTSSAFNRVHVTKKDENGNIRFYEKKVTVVDPDTKLSRIETRKISELTYIEDAGTGNLYLDEPMDIVMVKCAFLVLGLPFFTFGKIGWHMARTPIEIGTICIDALTKIGPELALGHLYESAGQAHLSASRVAQAFGTGLFEVVKAPFYLIAAEFAAIYGIFKPYHGRRLEAAIEKAWQNGTSYKEDFRNIPARSGETCWQAFKTDIQIAHTFYLAHCFQVRGNVNDPRFNVLKRAAL